MENIDYRRTLGITIDENKLALWHVKIKLF